MNGKHGLEILGNSRAHFRSDKKLTQSDNLAVSIEPESQNATDKPNCKTNTGSAKVENKSKDDVIVEKSERRKAKRKQKRNKKDDWPDSD